MGGPKNNATHVSTLPYTHSTCIKCSMDKASEGCPIFIPSNNLNECICGHKKDDHNFYTNNTHNQENKSYLPYKISYYCEMCDNLNKQCIGFQPQIVNNELCICEHPKLSHIQIIEKRLPPIIQKIFPDSAALNGGRLPYKSRTKKRTQRRYKKHTQRRHKKN